MGVSFHASRELAAKRAGALLGVGGEKRRGANGGGWIFDLVGSGRALAQGWFALGGLLIQTGTIRCEAGGRWTVQLDPADGAAIRAARVALVRASRAGRAVRVR